MIRTKIIATMGPACGDVETLHRLFEAGADMCRLNFSHGTLDQHLLTLRNIHEAGQHRWSITAGLGGVESEESSTELDHGCRSRCG